MRGALVVCLLAVAMLLLDAQVLDLSRIHISGLDDTLNDQVGYIGAARALADTGTLHSNIVFPSTLLQNASRDYLYLPGHYVALALSYKLFGYGVLQSLLPNLLSYIIAAVCVFLSGARLYNRRIGMLAAFLFSLFPANIIYAGTAMSEMTRVATTILALTVFLYLPRRWQLPAGPLLAVIPFLFRETGALVLIPMATWVVASNPTRGWWRASMLMAMGLLVLIAVYQSDLSAGRLSLMNAFVFDPRVSTVYTDALANQAVASKSAADWAWALPANAVTNTTALVSQLVLHPQAQLGFEASSVAIILLGMFGALAAGVWLGDVFLIGAGSLTGTAVALLLMLYNADLRVDLRWLLFAFPFEAIVFARLFDLLRQTQRIPRLVPLMPALNAALIILIAWLSIEDISSTAQRVTANDTRDDRYAACLEQLSPDPAKLLVAPYYMAQYLYLHYPVRGAFVPANPATLGLLARKYDIGLVVGRTTDGDKLADSSLTVADLKAVGLTPAKETSCGSSEAYLVFSEEEQAYRGSTQGIFPGHLAEQAVHSAK